MSHLTKGVERELERYLKSVDTRVSEALGGLNDLESHVGQLRNGLGELEGTILTNLQSALRVSRSCITRVASLTFPEQESADSATHGLEDVRSLHDLINTLIQTVHENHVAVSSSHEVAIQSMTQKTERDMSFVLSALAAVAASTSTLQNEMVRSFPLSG